MERSANFLEGIFESYSVTVHFLHHEYITYGIITLGLAVIGYAAMLISKRRIIPQEKEIVRYTGIFPSFFLRLAVLFLILTFLGGQFVFLSQPIVKMKYASQPCEGAFVVFVRDGSDSMKKEKNLDGTDVIQNVPFLPDIVRKNAFWITTEKIKELVRTNDCFQAALVDFQEYAGVMANFTPIPEKRDDFIRTLELATIFAPGSDIFESLKVSFALIDHYERARKGPAFIVVFSDGAEEKYKGVNAWHQTETLQKIQEARKPVVTVGVGSNAFGPMIRYDYEEKKFVPYSGVRLYDGYLKLVAEKSRGRYFIFDDYTLIRASDNSGLSFEKYFHDAIAKHRVFKPLKTVEKEYDISWYFMVVSAAALFLAAGLANSIFKLFGALQRKVSSLI